MSRVLDASVTLAWLFPRENSAEAAVADRALRELPAGGAVVPAIWYAEVANGVLRGERMGVVQPSQSIFFLERLSQAMIATDDAPLRDRQVAVLALARAHGLTVYDACYLELALRRGAVLATFDRKLAEAGRAVGVKLFGDPD